jgi:hypothetical protein
VGADSVDGCDAPAAARVAGLAIVAGATADRETAVDFVVVDPEVTGVTGQKPEYTGPGMLVLDGSDEIDFGSPPAFVRSPRRSEFVSGPVERSDVKGSTEDDSPRGGRGSRGCSTGRVVSLDFLSVSGAIGPCHVRVPFRSMSWIQ